MCTRRGDIDDGSSIADRLAAGALSDDGIFAMQTGSPLLMRDDR